MNAQTPEPDFQKILNEAALASTSWFSIGDELKKHVPPKVESVGLSLLWAFDYGFVEASSAERREQWGPYAPSMEWQGGVFPPPLSTIDQKWLKTWADMAGKSDAPVVKARLNDLLWERRWDKRPDLCARTAIDAYLEISKGSWQPLYRAEALARALELASSINDTDRLELAIKRCVDETLVSLKPENDPKPGVTFRLIEALMRLPSNEQPGDLDGLLNRTEVIYASDPWHAQTILELKEQRSKDPEQIKSLRLAQVKKWQEEAKNGSGLKRLINLQKALELARNYGLSEMVEELLKEIQEISPKDLELKTVSATVEIPKEQIEQFLSQFTSHQNWQESLQLFGSYGPPSGDYERNLGTLDEQRRKFPFQFFVRQLILNRENIPTLNPSSDAEIQDANLSKQEALGISVWALSASEILKRISSKFGKPSSNDLTDFFTTTFISKDIAERLARAIILFWDGQPDESAHALVPRIEAIIRNIAREAGLVIIRAPQTGKPGGVRALGDIIASLSGKIDESWRRYLRNLLCDPIGINLRNRISHGLVPIVEHQESALLIHAACFLRLLTFKRPESSDSTK